MNTYIQKLHSLWNALVTYIKQDIAPHSREKDTEMEREVRTVIASSVKSGFLVIAVLFVFFIIWGGLAPIDSAVVAPGSVSLQSNRKTVQHLEGGIISEILVKEGEFVEKNQPLIYLNASSASAQQSVLMGQLITELASESRLVAARDGTESIALPVELANYPDQAKVAELIDGQKRLFESKKSAKNGKIDILEERIGQYHEQITGLEIQGREVKKQLLITSEQIKTAQELFNRGYGQKSRMLEFQNSEAELQRKKAEYESQIATTNGSISETKLQVLNEENDYIKEVIDELKDVQQKISGFRDQLQAYNDVLARTVIYAPIAGKVTGLKQHTIGGVIMAGAPLMEIIPKDDSLEVEVYVQTQDIDVVHEGLPAKIMLTAYRSRVAPKVDGKVTYVSADKFTEDKTGKEYYMAHVKIDAESLKTLGDGMTLYPGMPAEIFITTGETTLLKYLARPLMDSVRKSVRE